MIVRRAREEDGIVMMTAMIMLTVMLGLALAVLAIVDTQIQAATQETRDDVAFNTAESVMRSASAVLAEEWVRKPGDTRSGSPACGDPSQAWSASTTNRDFGDNLADLVDRTVASPGTWRVNVCAAAPGDQAWSETFLTSRAAHASSTVPRLLWVRAQTTISGATRTVTTKVQSLPTTVPFPSDYALITGAIAADLKTATSTLTNAPLLAGMLNRLLDQSDLFEDNAARIGVRCALLDALDGRPCVTGTLAGAANLTDTLGAGPLNTLLGIDRTDQIKTYRVASDAQIEAYRDEAEASGTRYTSVNDGTACIPSGAVTNASTVVFVERVGGGTGTCTITDAARRTVKALIIESGAVRVTGPGAVTTSPTLTGILYALNDQKATGDVVWFERGGWVRGAVFVDHGGRTRIDLPPISVTTSLCNALGLLLRPACVLLSGVGLVDYLTANLGVDALVTNLLPQLSGYTAVHRDPALLSAASSTVYRQSRAVPGTFRQVRPN